MAAPQPTTNDTWGPSNWVLVAVVLAALPAALPAMGEKAGE